MGGGWARMHTMSKRFNCTYNKYTKSEFSTEWL
jgi:hypothetical protein